MLVHDVQRTYITAWTTCASNGTPPRPSATFRCTVSFEEAETVFSDEQAILLPDPDHSREEDRFLLLGFSLGLRVLVVVHCSREDETVIRIISARKASPSERAQYGARWKR